MLLLCSACRKKKPSKSFCKNKGSKRGFDCYCKKCRAQYYRAGRTWPDAKDRKADGIARGVKLCPSCQTEKQRDEFYKSSRADGLSAYCKSCCTLSGAAYYASPKGQKAAKDYNSRPDVIARIEAWKRATPRHMLSKGLNVALKRRPTANPVSVNELLTMWLAQEGKCAISGIAMTWRGGKTMATSISIDRIESSAGYSKNNVRLICTAINRFRGNGSDAEMIEMARAIIAKADASAGPTWKPHLVHSEAA